MLAPLVHLLHRIDRGGLSIPHGSPIPLECHPAVPGDTVPFFNLLSCRGGRTSSIPPFPLTRTVSLVATGSREANFR